MTPLEKRLEALDRVMSKEQFRNVRLAMKKTQKELAFLLGFSDSAYIRKLERGDRPITPRTQRLLSRIIEDHINNRE